MDLRETIEAAVAEQQKSDVEDEQSVSNSAANDAEPAPASSESAAIDAPAGQARDEAGRFARKQEPAAVVAAPAAEAASVVAEVKAPSSWKPEAQAAYVKAQRGEALSADEVRTLTGEAARRESDFLRGIGEFKSHADRARDYDRAIAPYAQTLQAVGMDAPTAIAALFKADHTLRTSDPVTKRQYFDGLAKQYGIDLSQPAPQIDPQQQFILQQLQALREQQLAWQNQTQQQARQQFDQDIGSFAADKPHFEAVRNEMADLLESGKAKTLQEAYDGAVWMNAGVRKSLIDAEREQARRDAEAKAQTLRAKTAAVSVKGSGATAASTLSSGSSLRDHIEAAFATNQ